MYSSGRTYTEQGYSSCTESHLNIQSEKIQAYSSGRRFTGHTYTEQGYTITIASQCSEH